MKKIYYLFITFLIVIPLSIVDAEGVRISCNNNKTFDMSECSDTCNFTCTGIIGDNIRFTYNNEIDYTDYFKVDSDKKTIDIIKKDFKFDSNFDYLTIIISDGVSSGAIKIKNNDYERTTTPPSSTTKDPNIKEVTVTLDPNNGDDVTNKTCNIVSGSENCTITLPKLEVSGFNGWGTAKTCTSGNSGSIRVEKDTTYYACYFNRENQTNTLYLESLEIKDKNTEEVINFGTFSRRKTEYEFKVLYEIENLDIKATAIDGVEVSIIGNELLTVGENEIIIKLSNDNNETSEYKLLVTRLDEGETIDNTHYLKSLVIGGYPINFNKETFIYNLIIPSDVNKLEITAIVEKIGDSFEIRNNENLVDGSKIEIIVKGEDDEVTVYTINITKKSKSNLIIIIIISLITLLIIILIVVIIIKSNKKKKNNSQFSPQILNTNNNDIEVLNL